MKRITQEDFIRRASSEHKGHYSYEKAVINGAQSYVTIVCPQHGEFVQRVDSHLKGRGRKECGNLKISAFRKSNLDAFLTESKLLYGDKFGYDRCIYNGYNKTLELFCKIHGYFKCLPTSHLKGNSSGGCKKCSNTIVGDRTRSDTETFISKAKEIHGDTYDYNFVKYTTSSEKIKISCKVHGIFEQRASHHLAGQGCRLCTSAGFDNEAPAHLYILKYSDITKVGITNKHPEIRVSSINKSSELDFDVETYFKFSKGISAREIEKKCLIYLRAKYQQVPEVFDGSTECFLNVDLNGLLQFVTPIATQSELDNKPAILAQ